MNILSRLRLRTKLVLLMGLSALALIVTIGIAASVMRHRMIDDRFDKLHAEVDSAMGLAQALQDEVAASHMTHAQALERMRAAVHRIRFDGGPGYIFGQMPDGVIALHGADPKLEGIVGPAKDASGRLITRLIEDAVRSSDDGFFTYTYPKPGSVTPQPKVAYVERFRPWGDIMFVAGAYTDDLDAAFRTMLWQLSFAGGVVLLATLAATQETRQSKPARRHHAARIRAGLNKSRPAENP